MSKVITKLTTSNVKTWEELRRYVSQDISAISEVVNGQLDFDNLKTSTVGVTFETADTDTKIAHGLNRVPTSYILIKSSVAMSLYDGVTESNDKELFLRSSAAGTARVIIF